MSDFYRNLHILELSLWEHREYTYDKQKRPLIFITFLHKAQSFWGGGQSIESIQYTTDT